MKDHFLKSIPLEGVYNKDYVFPTLSTVRRTIFPYTSEQNPELTIE